jgi:hypothetical protein
MAVANVSAKDKDPVITFLQGFHDIYGVNPAGAHGAHNAEVGRILKPGNPRGIGPGIGAPVTEKAYDFRLEFFTHQPTPFDFSGLI